MARPEPRNTTTCVLSIITRWVDPLEVTHRGGEKHLAVEALERGQDLEEQHPRVTQHRRGGLRLEGPPVNRHRVGRCVVLGFLAGRELVTARRDNRLLPDPLAPAESGQRLIGQRRAAGRQFLMDSHEIALAFGQ